MGGHFRVSYVPGPAKGCYCILSLPPGPGAYHRVYTPIRVDLVVRDEDGTTLCMLLVGQHFLNIASLEAIEDDS